MQAFANSRMEVPRYRSSPTFFFSVHSAIVPGKSAFINGVNCRLQHADLMRKERKV